MNDKMNTTNESYREQFRYEVLQAVQEIYSKYAEDVQPENIYEKGFDDGFIKACEKIEKIIKDIQPQPNKHWIMMPSEITAENGAKSLLIGEFHEEIDVPLECDGEDGPEYTTQKVPISWDTIKDIYRKIVTFYNPE